MKNLATYLIALSLLQGLLFSCKNFSAGKDTTSEAPGEKVSQPEKDFGIELPKSSEETPEQDARVRLETTPKEIREQLEKIDSSSVVVKFYQGRDFEPAWNKPSIRSTFVEELQKVGAEGLFLTDYYDEHLDELYKGSAKLDQNQSALLDILLTKAFLSYSQHLYYGKLNPQDLYLNWGVSRKRIDWIKWLQKGLEKDEIAETLNSLKPSHQVYKDLKKSLQEYAELRKEEQSSKKIPTGNSIKPGEKDRRVPLIAQRLWELGFLKENYLDSLYNHSLQQGIRQFQEEKGLQVDGIIGNLTIAELNMTPEERYRQILANLERWRWYPRDLGDHYILINIPQFKLAVVKAGDTVRTHNVIAGSRSRQTPIFTDTLQYVVVNPTWTIPPTIKTRDIIPKAIKDPSYLPGHNMTVYGKDGKALDPYMVDWNSSKAKSYTIVQRAGPSNPLGQVKIIYPNQYLIYLHDTPAQGLFSQNQRAESSGCVRVENAVGLSAYVLNSHDEGWDEKKMREAIASGRTREVKINRPIQVHHFYWTAWRADNKTVFTEDVYRLDKEIYTRLLPKN